MEGLEQLVSVFPTYPEKFNPDTATDLTFFVTFLDCLGLVGTGLNGEACKGCAYVHCCLTDVGRCKSLIPHSAGMPKNPCQLAFGYALFFRHPVVTGKELCVLMRKKKNKLAFDKNA